MRLLDFLAATRVRTLIALILVAFAARGVQFGNPVVHGDDQFYLLAGDRMLHGALMYVDIWDRKPVGLFLIYAGIRALGGEGVLAYQIVATLFAIVTAYVIVRAAREIASAAGAVAAGLVYILYLNLFGGEAGQSPVFYNLPIALAGWAMLRVIGQPGFGRRSLWLSLGAMALCGLALQIKYSIVFEGAWFGVALLWKARREGLGWAQVVGLGALCIAVALLPTAAVFAFYATTGHFQIYFFSNFESIFGRNSDPWGRVLKRLWRMMGKLSPLIAAALMQMPSRQRPDAEVPAWHARWFAIWWGASALIGVLVFGSYFDHYALPLLVPLCVAAAPLLGDSVKGVLRISRTRFGVPVFALMAIYTALWGAWVIDFWQRERGVGVEAREMAAVIEPRLKGDCLFVFDGDAALYLLTHSCIPTPLAYPDHFINPREDGAMAYDPLAEAQRVMASKPQIVVSGTLSVPHVNQRTWGYMQAELARDYRIVRSWNIQNRNIAVFGRRDDAGAAKQ